MLSMTLHFKATQDPYLLYFLFISIYYLVTFNLLFAVGAFQRNSYNLQRLHADSKLYLFQGIPLESLGSLGRFWEEGLSVGVPAEIPNLILTYHTALKFWIDIPECKFQHPAAICHPRSTWSLHNSWFWNASRRENMRDFGQGLGFHTCRSQEGWCLMNNIIWVVLGKTISKSIM